MFFLEGWCAIDFFGCLYRFMRMKFWTTFHSRTIFHLLKLRCNMASFCKTWVCCQLGAIAIFRLANSFLLRLLLFIFTCVYRYKITQARFFIIFCGLKIAMVHIFVSYDGKSTILRLLLLLLCSCSLLVFFTKFLNRWWATFEAL